MKKQAQAELGQLGREALNQKLAEARKELAQLVIKGGARGKTRQQIARLKTYLKLL
jgi:ribosomal protein L29